MPRVPTIAGPSVAEAGLPDVRQSSVATPELLGGPARQAQAFGDAATNLGVQINAQIEAERKQYDALRVDDALNKAQEAAIKLRTTPGSGFADQTGVAALSRESGMPLADEYTSKLKQQVDQIAGTLTPQQRTLFGMKANDVVRGFYGQAMEHERTQRTEYTLSVRDATVTNAKNALALNPSDPKNVEFQINRIRGAYMGGVDEAGSAIPGSAQMQGKSAAWAKEKADEAVSSAHEMAIKSALEQNNVDFAVKYFNKFASQMTAKDVLAVQGTLQKDYDTRLGAKAADVVFDGAKPALQPSDYTRLTTLVMGQESGGQRYGADGKLITSPKGALGEMQVMPATAKDPGYGVKAAKDDSPEELARVGRDYLAAMVVKYKGDVPKALAAYNAGPGAVDKAVEQAGSGLRSGSDFMTYLPKETQDYVRAISGKFAAGVGAPQKPTLQDLHDQARAILGPTASPLAVKSATETLTQRFTDAEKADKQRSDETVARAMLALTQNGGRFSDLPASIRADLNQHAPDKIDNVMNFGARVAKGDDTTNPALYLKLSDPGYLRTLSDAQMYQMRGELSQSDFQHFVNERQKILNPSASTAPGDLNSSAIKNVLDQRLRELKIDPTPKDDGGNDSARVGAIRRYVDTEVLSAQRAAGKKFTDAETAAFVDRLFAQSAQLKGWVSTYNAPLLSTKPGDIPSAERDAIKAAFKKQGVDDPTDAQILGAFLHAKTKR